MSSIEGHSIEDKVMVIELSEQIRNARMKDIEKKFKTQTIWFYAFIIISLLSSVLEFLL